MQNQNKNMEINRETAMRLWNSQIGSDTKATDFAGREIVKGAYDNRNSQYCWNVDHILPVSKGGKTADHNLIICHIKTNDEKKDNFPTFNANGKRFQIIKVQNHYEIDPLDKPQEQSKKPNLLDSAYGMRLFKKLTKKQEESIWVGIVEIKIRGCNEDAVVDFISNIFTKEHIACSMKFEGWDEEIIVKITSDNLPLVDDVQELLDKCILLKTYLDYFFVPSKFVSSFNIYYKLECYRNRFEFYKNNNNSIARNLYCSSKNNLYINKNVYKNSEAKKREPELRFNGEYTEYNYVYTKLGENLKKGE